MADKKTKDQNPEAAAAAEPKRGRMGVAIVAVLLLSNAGLAAVVATGALGAAGRAEGTGDTAAEGAEQPAQPTLAELGPVLPLDPFVLNLDEPGRPRYLRVAMSIELEDTTTLQTLETRVTVLRDRFITHLSSQQADQLRTPDDKDRLRAELVRLAGEVVAAPSRVHGIYFTEFLIQ